MQKYYLRLYIKESTPASLRAIKNLDIICKEELKGRVEVEIIDVMKQPQLAEDDQILAVPTLVKRLPKPLRKLIGDLSNKELVLFGLDLAEDSKMSA